MRPRMDRLSRREFVGGSIAAGIIGLRSDRVGAEPPPETTTIRLPRQPYDVACLAPIWVAEELLRGEGFTNVRYVETPTQEKDLAAGTLDFIISDVTSLILYIDAGSAVTVIGGVHAGCYELIGTARIRSIRDLKGGTVAVANAGRQAFVASMASYVGLNPRTDIKFVSPSPAEAIQLLAEGKIDAVLGFPPEPQEMRAKKIGHPVVSTAVDRPWSQYFCCLVAGNREFVREHPIAAKRVLRAILKATDICAAEPERVTKLLVDRGYVRGKDYALQAIREIPYTRWRTHDSADTIRFHALRMREAGVITSSPQKIIAQGTDWRFINELKKELKG